MVLSCTESGRAVSRRRSRRRLNTLQVKQLQDGEDIYTALMNAPDPTAFQVKEQFMLVQQTRSLSLILNMDGMLPSLLLHSSPSLPTSI